MRRRKSLGIPAPSSLTAKRTVFASSLEAERVIVLPEGEYFIAFEMKLAKTLVDTGETDFNAGEAPAPFYTTFKARPRKR